MPTKEINDGVDRAFQFSELVVELLDTPEVQRTEHITNNGLCIKGFPSIKHPRKAHLIGTTKKATQTYEALRRNGSDIPETFLLTLEALGILHDVGHPPFAHALRHIIESMSGKTHEQVSAEIVKGDITFHSYFYERPHLLGNPEYVKEALKEYGKRQTVPEILGKFGVDVDLVAEVLQAGATEKPLSLQNQFLRELIDGSLIDIDKMDYLPRDARQAGIEEGNVDAARILNGLKIVNVGDERHLAVVDTSLDDLCMWVSARKYMYQNIYTHKTVLKYEAMLTEAVKRSMDYFKRENIEIHLLTDDRLFNLLTNSDPVSAQLAIDVQFGRKRKYSEAFAIRSRKVLEGNNEYQRLMGLMNFVKSQEGDFPEDAVRDEIIKLAGGGIDSHEVLVYFPYKHKTKEQWKDKLDLYVYSHKEPSKVSSLKDMVDRVALLEDSKACDVFYELCKPQTSVYFAVYCKPERRWAVSKAAEKFAESVKRK
jgi:HD superfamily phosphohydrolase